LVGEQSAEQQQEFTILFVVYDILNSYVFPNVGIVEVRYGVDSSSSCENLVSQWGYVMLIYMTQEFLRRASAEEWFCYHKSRHTTMGVFHIQKSCLNIIKNTGCTCALHWKSLKLQWPSVG